MTTPIEELLMQVDNVTADGGSIACQECHTLIAVCLELVRGHERIRSMGGDWEIMVANETLAKAAKILSGDAK